MGIEANLKQDFRQRLDDARARTDALFRIVHPDALYDRPIPERHRIIFYIGHLEAFDWNLLCRDSLGHASVNPEFERLFAFGIDPVEGGLPQDQPADWPALEQVTGYRARTRRMVDEALQQAEFDNPSIPYYRSGWAFRIAVEHRLMHAETFGYMLHWLPFEKKEAPHTVEPEFTGACDPRRMIEIPAGTITLGIDRRIGPFLGWDNEYQQNIIKVPAFAIDSHKVTNGDYLKFVHNGGYEERLFWAGDDWEWVRANGVAHPRFWMRRGGQWFWRGLFNEYALPLDWPVYVSHAEASAYARWAGKSLPTEAQFERAAFGSPAGNERPFPWGDAAPAAAHGNFDFQRWDPVPVGSRPAGNSAFGVTGLVGNGWEWTSTLFAPFPGFQPLPFYPGYSANFFDGKHFVMKGGSPLTHGSLLRRTFRNWFQPHYPNIYASFRCVEK